MAADSKGNHLSREFSYSTTVAPLWFGEPATFFRYKKAVDHFVLGTKTSYLKQPAERGGDNDENHPLHGRRW